MDAALRPCVPVFLFASGYLTALSGRVPLAGRITAALIPYAIAFAAAYLYMALHNPAMDHRVTTTLARFGFAYVLVYYYVFVYVGCTAAMWLILAIAGAAPWSKQQLAAVLILAIAAGLVTGSYLDPALARVGLADSWSRKSASATFLSGSRSWPQGLWRRWPAISPSPACAPFSAAQP